MIRRLPRVVVLLALALLLQSQASMAAPMAPASTGPTRLEIPAIDLDAPVEPVSYSLVNRKIVWQTADRAVGWHRSSAMPGYPGNAVMSGHNATRGTKVFRNLDKVKVGDTIIVTVGGERLEYVVTERVIFLEMFVTEKRRAENARWLSQFGDERLTLVTCYPRFTNTHRLLVIAHPAGSEADNAVTPAADLLFR
ncbi:MAG: sortase [Caldilineae bacterium]|nr:sortase [Anaerolineae bacterium]MCB0203426.1 sortase [Anaerolineae bacterium]MCB9154299.1 sortase [Caldilineae bacterium]